MFSFRKMVGKRLFVAFVAVAVPWQAWTEEKGAVPWRAALTHLYAGDYAKALSVLTPLEEKYVGNPDFDLTLGSVLFHLKDYGAAMFPLERILMSDPGNETARLLLAMSLHMSGETVRARAEAADLHFDRLAPVLVQEWQAMVNPQSAAQATPASVTAPAATPPAPPPSKGKVAGHVQASIGPDTNVTVGPFDHGFLIPAYSDTYPISLGKAAGHRDWVSSLSGVLTGSYALDTTQSLIGGLSLYQTRAFQRHDKEEGYGNVYGGMSFTFDDVIVTPVGYTQAYMQGGVLLQKYWGGQVNVAKPLNNQQSLTSYLQFINTTYPDYPTNDTQRLALGTTHTFKMTDIPLTHSQLVYVGKEFAQDTDSPSVGYKLAGLTLGTAWQADPAWTVSGSLGYEYRYHPDLENLYYTRRADNQLQAVLSATHTLDKSWLLVPKLSYIHNYSNVPINAYDRFIASLAIQWSFGQ
ncbi:MAG: DUF560 domain-containing protein [Magnetococcales bacterium]|nr:DUF560 domain-containing protein [Magnetococcales bacterium]